MMHSVLPEHRFRSTTISNVSPETMFEEELTTRVPEHPDDLGQSTGSLSVVFEETLVQSQLVAAPRMAPLSASSMAPGISLASAMKRRVDKTAGNTNRFFNVFIMRPFQRFPIAWTSEKRKSVN